MEAEAEDSVGVVATKANVSNPITDSARDRSVMLNTFSIGVSDEQTQKRTKG